jgi:hypothetical protein
MALEITFRNNTTNYINGYAKIIKLTDDSINRLAKVQVAFFSTKYDSHSSSRIVFVDEFVYDGSDYVEIFDDYSDNIQAKAVTYAKVKEIYLAKWTGVSDEQNIVDGKEKPLRDEVIKEKEPLDTDFEVAGADYIADPTAPKLVLAEETYKETRDYQLEKSDILFGEYNEYPDKPKEWSLDFEVALTEI